ncbi:hypothetical protein CSHISOI_00994 [Colletotrichum shisoi]|uniref:Uncharacterized protein n=1 Tax=Colletotrichum shisoi TaxID=2078593 RepID=A0A5Q4C562_9PEZI|nr:hypothetical protein CSHISOI_00994 [Colletotrichum shisoi]
MAPIPDIIVVNAEKAEAAAASVLHHLARRDEEKSRTAGWIVGLLVTGCIILTLIYYCLDDAFGMKPRKGKKTANRTRPRSNAVRHGRHASQDTGSTVRLMPPHIVAAVPIFPPAAAAPAAGTGGDAFVDYGPAPDQDLGPAWVADPNFRLEQVPAGRDGDSCWPPLLAAFRGAPRGAARGPRREAAGERQAHMNDDEMEAA